MSILEITNYINTSDDIDSSIIECIYKSIDSNEDSSILTESALIIPQMNEYRVLIESITDIKEVQKDIDSKTSKYKNEKDIDKKLSMIDKIIKPAKDAYAWWYKVDPNKKHQTAKIVLKIAIEVISILITIFLPGKLKITKDIAKVLPFGYKGTNKALEKLFGKEAIAEKVVSAIITSICIFMKSIDKKIEYNANKKDIDENIKALDKTVDQLNSMIDKCENEVAKSNLIKNKKSVEDALKKLILIKESHKKTDE